MPVSQKAAVQQPIVRGDRHITPSGEELVAYHAAKKVILDDKAEPKIFNIAFVSLNLEEVAMKLRGARK
jgi:hypothetical protein